MATTSTFAHHTCIGILLKSVLQYITDALLCRDIHMLSNAVQIAVEQSSSGGIGGMHSSGMLCLLSTCHRGGVICWPGNAHQAAHGVCNDVAGFVVCVGTCLSKAGDRAVDQPGIDGVELFIAQSQ